MKLLFKKSNVLNLTTWKLLLVLATVLISIASGEIAIVVIGLILSVYADEMRFRVLFKERREMIDDIKEIQGLSKKQMDEIVQLQDINKDQTDKINRQTNRIVQLQGLSKKQMDEIVQTPGYK